RRGPMRSSARRPGPYGTPAGAPAGTSTRRGGTPPSGPTTRSGSGGGPGASTPSGTNSGCPLDAQTYGTVSYGCVGSGDQAGASLSQATLTDLTTPPRITSDDPPAIRGV